MKDKATTDKSPAEKPEEAAETETPAAADEQPATFPVDFNEWRASQPATRRVLLAGLASEVRAAGDLLRKLPAEQWEERFQQFMAA